MASTIITKYGSGAPLASDLVRGELAVDTENGRLYTEDSLGAVVEIGTNPTTLAVDTDTLVVDAANNRVGIGTTNPLKELHIASSQPEIRFEDTSGTVNYGDIVYTDGRFIIATDGGNAQASSTIEFQVDGTERMRIDSSGNVLVKTANSGADVEMRIQNTATTAGDTATLYFNVSGSTFNSAFIGSNRDNQLLLTANNRSQPDMIINEVGNISIGDYSTEGAKVHIRTGNATTYNAASASGADGVNLIVHNDDSTANTTAGLILRTQVAGSFGDARINCIGVSQNNSAMTFHTENAGTIAEAMRIANSGNLLVGTTSDPNGSERIRVSVTSGTINGMCAVATTTAGGSALVNRNSSNTYVGGVTFTDTATSFPTSSDQRLKENILDAPSASDDIDAIQVRSFDWKANGSHQKYGMIAQELITVAPEAVYQPEDPEEIMGVDYSKLVPMMLKEIQSLRARVAQLEGAN